MFKKTLRTAAAALGYEIRRRQSPPPGSDWINDLKRLLPADHCPVLFDVGANIGQTSLALAKIFAPPATLFAFEPAQHTFAALTAALASVPHVRPHRLALSDQPGRLRLHHGHNSQLHRLTPVTSFASGTHEEVELTTLDQFTAASGLSHLTLLKTDTEGHDAAVLRGASGLLHRGAIRAVLAEVTFDTTSCLHSSFDEVRAILEPHDFRVHNFYDCEHWDVELKYCNALFLHSPDFIPATRAAFTSAPAAHRVP